MVGLTNIEASKGNHSLEGWTLRSLILQQAGIQLTNFGILAAYTVADDSSLCQACNDNEV